MTDKEKLEKIKGLADAMYNAAFNITTDASRLKKAMYDYHQFIIYEYYKEEPVSIWHNMDEVPIKGEVIVVQTKDTFYGLSVQKGGSTYKNRNKDRYVRWAYASDLLNLPNVQSAVKNWKKPVSEDLEEAAVKAFKHIVDSDKNNFYEIFKAGAKWGTRQAEVKIQAQSMALAHGCPKDFTCSNLEEEANDYAHDIVHDDVFETFIAGAQWQKEHLWKDAQGDDLPEIDKEVIALIEAFGHYKVIFAHRVDENAEIHTSIDGKPLVLHPKKHGKGGWNIPDVKFWLDLNLPKTEK